MATTPLFLARNRDEITTFVPDFATRPRGVRTPNIASAVAAAIMALGVAAPAAAQGPPCGDRAGIVAHLEKRYGEQTAVLALDAAGRMVQILANAETGSWTLLLVRPGGLACLAGHGTAWEPIPSTGSGQASPPVPPGHPT